MARLTLMPVLGLPFVEPVVGYVSTGRLDRKEWRRAAFSVAISLLTIGALFLLIAGGGWWRQWIEAFVDSIAADRVEARHAPFVAIGYYFSSGFTSVKAGLRSLGPCAVLAVFPAFVPLERRFAAALVGVAVGVAGYAYLTATIPWISQYQLVVDGLGLLAFPVLCAANVLRVMKDPENRRPAIRMLSLLVFVFVSMYLMGFGSTSGISKSLHAGWLYLPLIFAGTFLFPAGSASAKRWTRGAWPLLLALACLGLELRVKNPYRDLSDRSRLTVEIAHPRLRGVFTGASRAKSLGDLLIEVEKRSRPSDRVLVNGSAPLLYFLTATYPALDHSWISSASRRYLESRLARIGPASLPTLVIRTKADTYDPEWGYKKTSFPTDENTRFLDEWVKRQGYVEVWSNDDFALSEPMKGP